MFHNKEYPRYEPLKLKVLLKSSKVAEVALRESEKEQKKPVMLRHLVQLLKGLTNGNRRDQVALTIALVAFWGMARLGELVSDDKNKRQIKKKDVYWTGEYQARIAIHNAKTACPGQVQYLKLKCQPSFLDPTGALTRMVADNKTGPKDPLFSYQLIRSFL